MKKVFIISAGVVAAAIVIYLIKINQFYKKIYTPIPINPASTPIPERTEYNILLLGYAGGRHEGTYLTDTVIVMHFDSKRKQAFMLSLPRDLWVKLPTKSGADFRAKINTIYETELFPNHFPDLDSKLAGGKSDAELTKFILSQITGLEIDNYLAIDFASFTKAVDVLGGVDIDVARSFIDEKYPIDGKQDDLCEKDEQFKQVEPFLPPKVYNDEEKEKLLREKPELDEFLRQATEEPQLAFPCRYEKLAFAAGPQHMDGATALKFVRSRQSAQDGGDFARARRQQQLIEALRAKVLTVGFIPKLPSLLKELQDYIKTDVSPDLIKKFIGEVSRAGDYKLTSLVLSDQNVLTPDKSENGQFILIPKYGQDDWESVRKYIKDILAGITPTPSRSPTFNPIITK
ncbi:hypothetical protein A2774_05330 [Candidatus Roizmanbacteria bacterium RIFCSPHIGHO2_01_FULL_39_12c]|uniref:Cell envelope-related transcriptional attenuator domain-containing protein n=1 Tax=Candidatus Roizmanbacteria bacterium RIFCSPHIGHO2_01_FULL_39_12c TaxID=1802031 RepID=A0A1F7GE38_9BACT|nr:MAG: hypothetical protein A2774_05330 [Candidatus Roizmanbacteria bacterium RIFCSPHIGHO2_01_FULL_39_12c]